MMHNDTVSGSDLRHTIQLYSHTVEHNCNDRARTEQPQGDTCEAFVTVRNATSLGVSF